MYFKAIVVVVSFFFALYLPLPPRVITSRQAITHWPEKVAFEVLAAASIKLYLLNSVNL
jgi:hypothetical protein